MASAAEAARTNAASDRDEDRAEIAMAKAIRRTGPGQQSLSAAIVGALLPREIKRGLNAAMAPAIRPALLSAFINAPATPISDDPLAVEIQALMERRKAEEAQRLAAMTPAQRALYDRREAQRLAICADYRRHPNRR